MFIKQVTAYIIAAVSPHHHPPAFIQNVEARKTTAEELQIVMFAQIT